jgi:hypothetical protein
MIIPGAAVSVDLAKPRPGLRIGRDGGERA